MGLWDTVKEKLEGAKETAENATFTQNYSQEDAEQIVEEMKHDVDSYELRIGPTGSAPLDRLDEGEQLQYFLTGLDLDVNEEEEGYHTQLMVTDDRLIIIGSTMSGKENLYSISFNDIIGLSIKSRMTSHVRIQTAGHSFKISASLSHPDLAEEVVDYIRERKNDIESSNGGSEEESAIAKIDKLADLHDKGAISEEEFNKKKQELMDDI